MTLKSLNIWIAVFLPVLTSLKVLNSNDKTLLKSWLKLLTVLLLVTNLETSNHFQAFYEHHVPFKKYGILLLNLWIVSPYSKGYIILFNQFIQPLFSTYCDFPKVKFKKDNSTVYLNSEKLYGLNNLFLEKFLDKWLQLIHKFILCSLTATFGFGKKELYFYQRFIKEKIPAVYFIFLNYYESLNSINADLRVLQKRYQKKIMSAICHAVDSSPTILTKMEQDYIKQKKESFLNNNTNNDKYLEHFSKFKEDFIHHNMIIPSPNRNLYVERFILQYKEYANSPSLFNISLSLILFIYNFLSNYVLILFYKTFRIGMNDKKSSRLFTTENEKENIIPNKKNSKSMLPNAKAKITEPTTSRVIVSTRIHIPDIITTQHESSENNTNNDNVTDPLRKRVAFATQDIHIAPATPSYPHPKTPADEAVVSRTNQIESSSQNNPGIVKISENQESVSKSLLPSYTLKIYPAQSIDNVSNYDDTNMPISDGKLNKSRLDQSGTLQVTPSSLSKRRNSIKEFLKGGSRHGLSRFTNSNGISTKRNSISVDQLDEAFANSTTVASNQSLKNNNLSSSFYSNGNNSRVSTIDEKRENNSILSNELFLKSLNDLPSGSSQLLKKKSSSGRLAIHPVYGNQNNAISMSSNLKMNTLLDQSSQEIEKELVSPISLDSADHSNRRNFTIDSQDVRKDPESVMIMSDPFGAILNQDDKRKYLEQESKPFDTSTKISKSTKNIAADGAYAENACDNSSSASRSRSGSPERKHGFPFFKRNRSIRNSLDAFISGEESFSTLDFNQVGKQFDPRSSFDRTSRRSIDGVFKSIRKSMDSNNNNNSTINFQETVNPSNVHHSSTNESSPIAAPKISNTTSDIEDISKNVNMDAFLQLTGSKATIGEQADSKKMGSTGKQEIPDFKVTDMDSNKVLDKPDILNGCHNIVSDVAGDFDSVSSSDSWNDKDETAGLHVESKNKENIPENNIRDSNNKLSVNPTANNQLKPDRHNPQRSYSSIGVEFVHSFTPNINKAHGVNSVNNVSFSDRDTIDYLSYQPTNTAEYNKFPLIETTEGDNKNDEKKRGKSKKNFISDVLNKRKSKKHAVGDSLVATVNPVQLQSNNSHTVGVSNPSANTKKRSVSLVFRSRSKSKRESFDGGNTGHLKSQLLFRHRNSSVVSYSEDPCTY